MKCFCESKCQLTSLFKYVEYFAWGRCVGFKEWPGSDVSLLCLQPPKYREKHACHYQIARFIPETARRLDGHSAKNAERGRASSAPKRLRVRHPAADVSGVIAPRLSSGMSMSECSFLKRSRRGFKLILCPHAFKICGTGGPGFG